MINLKFHHIGIATKNIEKELPYYESLGYKKTSEIFCDHNQKIKGLFIEATGQPRLELLENLTPDGPLTNYLKKGIKFYHLAYETDNIEKDTEMLLKNGHMLISPIKEAVYFKKVCFTIQKNMNMIELVQSK